LCWRATRDGRSDERSEREKLLLDGLPPWDGSGWSWLVPAIRGASARGEVAELAHRAGARQHHDASIADQRSTRRTTRGRERVRLAAADVAVFDSAGMFGTFGGQELAIGGDRVAARLAAVGWLSARSMFNLRERGDARSGLTIDAGAAFIRRKERVRLASHTQYVFDGEETETGSEGRKKMKKLAERGPRCRTRAWQRRHRGSHAKPSDALPRPAGKKRIGLPVPA